MEGGGFLPALFPSLDLLSSPNAGLSIYVVVGSQRRSQTHFGADSFVWSVTSQRWRVRSVAWLQRWSQWRLPWMHGYPCLNVLYLIEAWPFVELRSTQRLSDKCILKWSIAGQRLCKCCSKAFAQEALSLLDEDTPRLDSDLSQVGLQSYTSYDLRVQETCIHNTSDSRKDPVNPGIVDLSVRVTYKYFSNCLDCLRSILAGWEIFHYGRHALATF